MTLVYPVPDLLTVCGWRQERFALRWRQETSRTASGQTIAKDLGPAVWAGAWTSPPLSGPQRAAVMAKIAALKGAVGTFLAWDLSRATPLGHASAATLGAPAVKNVTTDFARVRLQGLEPGARVEAGSLISWTDAAGRRLLFELLETKVADGVGDTTAVAFAPTAPADPGAGTSLAMFPAVCAMRIVPSSVQETRAGAFTWAISFEAEQDLG